MPFSEAWQSNAPTSLSIVYIFYFYSRLYYLVVWSEFSASSRPFDCWLWCAGDDTSHRGAASCWRSLTLGIYTHSWGNLTTETARNYYSLDKMARYLNMSLYMYLHQDDHVLNWYSHTVKLVLNSNSEHLLSMIIMQNWQIDIEKITTSVKGVSKYCLGITLYNNFCSMYNFSSNCNQF